MKSMLKKGLLLSLMLIVGITMTLGTTTEDVSAAIKKPSKVSIYSVKSADYNAIQITWKATKSTTKYQVYRATSKFGKYKKIATTSSTSYTNKKLTTGKTYYYKVRALNGKTKGSFSKIKSASPKLKPPVVTTSAGNTSVKISWKKVNGAKGYQIYRATSKNGKYKKVKSTSSTSWTNTKLSTGKKYYYKVRAYRKSGNKTLYSSYKSFSATTRHDHTWKEVNCDNVTQTVAGYYVCHGCGMIEASNKHMIAHIYAEEPSSSHADTIEKRNIVTDYRCSCGATKKVEKEYYEISCAGTINCREAGWVAPYAKTAEDIKKEHDECKRILEALKQGQENIEPPMGVSIPVHTHRWIAEYKTKDVQVGTEQQLVGTYYTCDGCGKEMTDADHNNGHLSVCGPGTETLQYKYEDIPIYETKEYISKFNCVCGRYCLWPNSGARIVVRCRECGDLANIINGKDEFLCFRCR